MFIKSLNSDVTIISFCDEASPYYGFIDISNLTGKNTLTAWVEIWLGIPYIQVAGNQAVAMEKQKDEETIEHFLGVLRKCFGSDKVQFPSKFLITKWASDEFSRGSYSYPGVGEAFIQIFWFVEAQGEDYDAMKATVKDR